MPKTPGQLFAEQLFGGLQRGIEGLPRAVRQNRLDERQRNVDSFTQLLNVQRVTQAFEEQELRKSQFADELQSRSAGAEFFRGLSPQMFQEAGLPETFGAELGDAVQSGAVDVNQGLNFFSNFAPRQALAGQRDARTTEIQENIKRNKLFTQPKLALIEAQKQATLSRIDLQSLNAERVKATTDRIRQVILKEAEKGLIENPSRSAEKLMVLKVNELNKKISAKEDEIDDLESGKKASITSFFGGEITSVREAKEELVALVNAIDELTTEESLIELTRSIKSKSESNSKPVSEMTVEELNAEVEGR